jgi:hypothetical protein
MKMSVRLLYTRKMAKEATYTLIATFASLLGLWASIQLTLLELINYFLPGTGLESILGGVAVGLLV